MSIGRVMEPQWDTKAQPRDDLVVRSGTRRSTTLFGWGVRQEVVWAEDETIAAHSAAFVSLRRSSSLRSRESVDQSWKVEE